MSVGFRKEFGVSKSSIVSIFTPNSIDFVPTVLATHRLGGIVSASNPQLTAKELAFQLETAKSRALIIGQEVLETGLEAAKIAGIPLERVSTGMRKQRIVSFFLNLFSFSSLLSVCCSSNSFSNRSF